MSNHSANWKPKAEREIIRRMGWSRERKRQWIRDNFPMRRELAETRRQKG